jgi:hypothetical protein
MRVRVLAAFAALCVAACSDSSNSAQGDRVIGITTVMTTLVVVKTNSGGGLSACLYENHMRPGDTYQSRGCQELAHQ